MYKIAQDQCHVLLQGRQTSGVLTGKKSVVSKQIEIFCFDLLMLRGKAFMSLKQNH